MKLTNYAGLPQALVDAVANDDYSRGESDITVTQLIAPPRQVALIRAHGDELEEDAADRIYSIIGQAIHKILERANREDFVEQRLYMDINGWKVGGQFDRMTVEDGVLSDWKTAKVDEIRFGVKVEREQQLNCLAHLARANGHKISAIEAVFILRDWSKVRAANDPTYPQKQVVVVPLPLWTPLEAQAYMAERVGLHMMARSEYLMARACSDQPQSVLPECSPEERWAKPDVWAVMKEGRKSAVKLFDTWEAEAQVYANHLQEGDARGTYYVQHRPGESLRCLYYCAAAQVCEQFRASQPEPEAEPFE